MERHGRYIGFVFAILMALGAGFALGTRYRADFYVWLFYEPFKEQTEAYKNLKKEHKALQKELKSCEVRKEKVNKI